MSKSVLSLAYTLIPPLLPAWTIAELATACPSGDRIVQTFGRVAPPGHSVTKLKVPEGMTVVFTTYAFAVDGIEQTLETGKFTVRVSPALRDGGPKAPVRPSKLYVDRVSTTRQGAI